MPTTIPEWIYPPDAGVNCTTTPSVIVSKFGDGYEARNKVGINGLKQKWDVKFTLTGSRLTSAETFLQDRSGSEAFIWKTGPNGTSYKVVSREWVIDHTGGGVATISTTFERVYEL